MPRWLAVDAVNLVVCPRCKQDKGKYCLTPSNRKDKIVHGERIKALLVIPEFNINSYRILKI